MQLRQKSGIRIAIVVVGIILFAAAMAVRYELPSGWQRAVIAGVAFAVLGLALLLAGRTYRE
jgi:ABC-type uncharacterized transport system permease subunit